MKPDYLWDRSGPPDPEIQRLEQLLGTLRSERPAPRFAARTWGFAPMAAAAALVLCAAWVVTRGVGGGWELARLTGSDRIAERGVLRPGEWLETDGGTHARLRSGKVGEVDVGPNSRVRLVRTRPAEQRMALERGEIRAEIWAPPRLFYVETPSAVAVDLGCSYTLKVLDDGSSLLNVDTGWVAFERNGREVFIPAGASCRTRPGIGPGTPFFEDASPDFQHALDKFDFEGGGQPALLAVLGESRDIDVLTLWHLLSRVTPQDRGAVFDRMVELSEPPEGVTRERVIRGDKKTLEVWWSSFGFAK